jgi:hypothetical protein
MLDHHINSLIAEFNLQPLSPPDEQKIRYLDLGDVSIGIKNLEQGSYFYSQLSPVPSQKKEELYIKLMQANFLGQGTGTSTIALTEDESFLTLSLALPYEINYLSFKETIEDFANFVEYWKKEIAKHQFEAVKNS